MHFALRNSGLMAAGLACRAAASCGARAAAFHRGSLRPIHTPVFSAMAHFCQSKPQKDYALPNPSWSQDMVAQFNRYMEMTKDGTWKRLPSYRNYLDHMPERMAQEHAANGNRENRMFLRSTDEEGKGFEYVMFVNSSEKKMVCVFQPGPYLEGPPGFAHGGSIATMLDSTLGGCAILAAGRVMTANLNINYKNPVPLGSVVLVETKVDKIEGRKLLISGQVRSIDGETLHTEATALFIQLASKKTPQQPEGST